MFRATFGMSYDDFWSDERHQQDIPKAEAWFYPSDEGGGSENEQPNSSSKEWSAWRSGEDVRDAAKDKGKWPDGAPVGRGHGSPYLKPHWAKRMRRGEKLIEGRPLDGVRSQREPAPPPSRNGLAIAGR